MPQNIAKVSQQRVTTAEDGQRLDNWLLARLKGVPRSHIYRLIRSGQVRINGGRVKPMTRVRAEDLVRVPPVRVAERGAAEPSERLCDLVRNAQIYRDPDVIGLDKPAGLAAHAGSGVMIGVAEIAKRVFGADWQLAHRLDRDTSGCLLLVRRRELQSEFQRASRDGRVLKRYQTLLHGQWRGSERVALSLSRNQVQGGERVVRADEAGREAVSHFRLIRACRASSLMNVELDTGRTHQIRVHASSRGHPVVGDDKYGDRALDRALGERVPRMFLHAAQLELDLSGRHISLSAALPAELTQMLESLSR